MLEHYIACFAGLDAARATIADAERVHATESLLSLVHGTAYPAHGLQARGFRVTSFIPATHPQHTVVHAPAAVILASACGTKRYLAFPDIPHATHAYQLGKVGLYGIHEALPSLRAY